MSRSMMRIFVKDSQEALELYEHAFNASPACVHQNQDGTLNHAELDCFGQTITLAETKNSVVFGNTMEFCFEFGMKDKDRVFHLYNVLKEGATINTPLEETKFSPIWFSLMDRHGVNWFIYVSPHSFD